MKKAKSLIIAAIVVVLATMASASPENSGNVRKEYAGREEVPDHVIFAYSLRVMALRYEDDRDFALVIVQDNMKTGSKTTAEQFVQRMLVAGDELEQRNKFVAYAVLCQDNSMRSKSDIYGSMDALDDARIANAQYAFADFMKALKKEEKKNFKAWLDDMKEGYSYIAFEHASLFEKSGTDVKNHLQKICVEYDKELAGAKQ